MWEPNEKMLVKLTALLSTPQIRIGQRWGRAASHRPQPHKSISLPHRSPSSAPQSPQRAELPPPCSPPPRMSSSAGSTKGHSTSRTTPSHLSPPASTVHVTTSTARQVRKGGLYLGPSFPSLEFGSALLQGKGRWISGACRQSTQSMR